MSQFSDIRKEAGSNINAQLNYANISNYKCVPLDLLKNIGLDDRGQYVIEVTSDTPTLRNFKENQENELKESGPMKEGIPADTLENMIVVLVSIFAFIIILVFLYYGFLNVRSKGLGAFSLPSDMRGLPAISMFSIVFAIFGFFIGWLVKQ